MSLTTYASTRASAAQDAFKVLSHQIIDGTLEPGQKLNIHEISESLGISRTPVKEAFNRMAEQGLLTIHPRRGTYVSVLAAEDVQDLFEVRLMMETWAVRTLAEGCNPGIVSTLGSLLNECEQMFLAPRFDYERFVAADRKFHNAIVGASTSQRLTRFYESIFPHIQLTRVYWRQPLERAYVSHRQHLAVLRAIRDDGPLYAVDALMAHIKSSRDDVIERLRDEADLQSSGIPGSRSAA